MDAAPLAAEPPITDTPPPATGRRWVDVAPLIECPGGDYRRLTDRDLPDSDGVPVETRWHVHARNLLIDSLEQHLQDRSDHYIGGDQFMYFSERHVFKEDFRGPDFYVFLGVDRYKKRNSWVAWQEGERLPDVIIELASESTLHIDRGEKKELYAERFRTPNYFIYDPNGDTLEGWELVGGAYAPLVPTGPHGRLYCRVLGVELGVWDGSFLREHDRWLRFYMPDGRVVPTFAEAAQQVAASVQANADAIASEIARLKAELAALRNPPPSP